MSHFNCTTCGKKYEVDQALAGRSFKCTQCREALRMPGEAKPENTPPIQRHDSEGESQKRKPTQRNVSEVSIKPKRISFANTLVFCFGLLMFGGCSMSAMTAQFRNTAVDGIHNIGLLNERQNAVIFNSAMAVSGLLFALLAKK